MTTGQYQQKTDKRHMLFGVAVLLLLLTLLAGILASYLQQTKPLARHEVTPAPLPEQKAAPTPAPVAVMPAPVPAKPQVKAPAPKKKTIKKPVRTKTATAMAMKTPKKPKAVTSKDKPATKPVKITTPQPLQTGYHKLDADGRVLPDDATEWACVQDQATGLVWEVKTDDNSIQDRDNFFTWYNPAKEYNFGDPGERDGGRCKGKADCDTLAYTQVINQKRLCGYADWRLPVKDELLSLVEYHYGSKDVKATINRNYFPRAVASWYWTASANPKHPDHAWFVLFRNGLALNAPKDQPKHVRLVRGSKSSGDSGDKPNPQYLAHLSE